MAKTPLDEYSKKRAFDATPEPAPAVVRRTGGPLLFVVQQHSARRLHYDFRLECDGVLLSWAVPRGPSLDPSEKRLAVQTEDHPYAYASFEGVIPPGQYGAGEVIVWDCGVYSPDEGGTAFHDRSAAQDRVRRDLAAGKLSFELRGGKLKGSFALVKTKEAKQWLLIKHKDRFVTTRDVTADARSVLSGVAVEDLVAVPAHRIPAARLVPCGAPVAVPAKLAPMLAESGDAAFDRAGWLWEPKLDGYRVLAIVREGRVHLRSRRGLDLAADFPALAAEIARQAVEGSVLDGEVVAFDAAGRPSFGALQERAQLKTARERAAADTGAPVAFFAFDMPFFAGVDLREAPYADRRRYLAQCLMPSALVQLVHGERDGMALQQAALATGFEGVIGKREASAYHAGRRTGDWLKVKPTRTADFVIGGYTRGKGSRAALGALLVGYWEGRKLKYASHVGSGFDGKTLASLSERLAPLEAKSCPFDETPELNGPTTWVRPEIVAEVSFQDWTDDARLRAPVFVRVRDDVAAKKVKRQAAALRAREPDAPTPRGEGMIGEVVAQLDAAKRDFTLAVGAHRIKLTNLDRVYWPAHAALGAAAVTKRDLLRYFAQVSPYMLPHLADRPLTMIRMPSGIEGERFFQKHWEQERPEFVESIVVYSGHKDESHEYLLCNNLPTLLWLAQVGTLELHVWHSRANPKPDAPGHGLDYASSLESLEASILNFPDYVVFDIDPYIYSGQEKPGDEPELNTVAFERGKEVAFKLRELLAGMKLDAVVKTSGKTGLHIFVPIVRDIDFDAARHVCELVGRHLMAKNPKLITMDWSIPKRTGKIFMDYNMNVRGKTLNVAYSPRGAAGAPVSMPLTWEELASAHPLDFRISNAIERLAATGDRWASALETKQDLEAALAQAKA
ncbi:MAG TPA: DNA ligase D [Usitatibacter sp.]|jgi:bifunctional non-homologous end joining protein LigD|nr:DNA ligase D [Usitatibacter sp.]